MLDYTNFKRMTKYVSFLRKNIAEEVRLDFLKALKAEVEKLDISKLVNVPTSLNNLKSKVDDLDVSKLKTVPVDLKKLSDVVDNEHSTH